MQTDHVDRILQQWQHERPELDPLAMSIFGRLWRLNAIASKAVEHVHLQFGLTQPEFDVLELSPFLQHLQNTFAQGELQRLVLSWN